MTADWRGSVEAYIRSEALPVDKFGHQPRLYALTVEIAGSLKDHCDDDVLFAAAWMHDLGVFVGHRPADPVALANWDHVPYTIRRSEELLREWGFPEAKLEGVAEAIRTHQVRDQAVLLEAAVLRDADILEQLGAAGILRTVSKVGRDTRFQVFPDALRALQKNLAVLPGQLRLPAACRLAEPRVLALKTFLDAAAAEGCLAIS